MRIIRICILNIILFLGLSTVVLASDITHAQYAGIITIKNTSTGATNVIVPFTLNTATLQANGMLNSGLSNCAVREGPLDVAFMPQPGTTNWWIRVREITANNSGLLYALYTGGSQSMNGKLRYFPGNIGMTTADSPTLELGSNFAVEISGCIDTDASKVGKLLVQKANAFIINVPSANTVGSGIFAASTSLGSSSGTVAGFQFNSASNSRAGTRFNNFQGLITQARVKLTRTGSPSGNLSCTVRRASNDTLLGTIGTMAAASVSTSATEYTFNANTVFVPYGLDVRILIEYTQGDASNYIRVSRSTSGSNIYTTYTGSYSDAASSECFWISYNPATQYVSATVTSGDHIINIYSDGGSLNIVVDGIQQASLPLYGGVPDNASNYITGANESMPYLEYQKIWVNGTLQQHVYFENTATFTDHSGSATPHDATPTFPSSSSDPDVSASLTSLEPINPSKSSNYFNPSGGSIFAGDPSLPSQMYTELNTNAFPGADIITAIFGVSGTPIALWWFPFIFIGIAIISLFIYELTSSGGTAEGSLLTQSITIEVLLAVFALVGSATGNGGMTPFWPVLLFPIPATAFILYRRFVGWG